MKEIMGHIIDKIRNWLVKETLGYRGGELMYISDADYCLEVNNITKAKTENKTIRTSLGMSNEQV
jgi:hypothetical protein